ncbi:SAM hydrolase/SAM-dependent halogenase family protein [Reichenbachiella sp.]|uniref:SAM hydrolase/SAM-dependent halogenase family protein n=1 Tax=Reichenbachiella sp. TaxID=2184521 RepID=UPI003BAEDA20
MAIVTFLSDFGQSDHYVAAVKASILKENPNINIVDISHQIAVGDVGHAAFVLDAVFRDFPEGTVHLFAVSNTTKRIVKNVAVKLENHIFIGEDSGLISLLSDERPAAVVDINGVKPVRSPFIAKTLFGPLAGKVASGKDIQDFGKRLEDIERLMPSRAKATKKQIAGNVIRIDHYGNLITNIMKTDFDAIWKINDNFPYVINFRREKVLQLHNHYSDVTSGECFVLFNSMGRLQIGINQGRGSELLGLMIGDQVFIDFTLET